MNRRWQYWRACQEADINQMPVIADEHIVGVIGRDTILRALQTRMQLGHSAS